MTRNGVDHRRQEVQQIVKNACDELNVAGVDARNYVEKLRRMVRCLKAWDDYQSGIRGKMANGLILTVLAGRWFAPDEDHDDAAFTRMVASISTEIGQCFSTTNPVDADEDLAVRLSEPRRKRVQTAFAELSEAMRRGVWISGQKHLKSGENSSATDSHSWKKTKMMRRNKKMQPRWPLHLHREIRQNRGRQNYDLLVPAK